MANRLARLGRAGLVTSAAASGATAGLIPQLVWAGHRRLPQFPDLDASGVELSACGRNEPAVRVVALGDSTLTGSGLKRSEEIWLRRAVRDLSLNRPVEVRSLAVGGSRVRDAAARVDEAIASSPDVAVETVPVVAVAIAAMVSRRRGAVLIDVAPANDGFKGRKALRVSRWH